MAEEIVENPVLSPILPGGLSSEQIEALAAEVFNYQPPIDYKRLRDIRNWNLAPDVRAAKAIVSPAGKATGGDYNDIQAAIDYVRGLGGGRVLIKAGTYTISSVLTLYSNIYLIGSGVGLVTFDASSLDTNVINATGTLLEDGDVFAGTIAVNNDSTTVTGTSTSFESLNLVADDLILIGGEYYEISSVGSDTSITLKKAFKGKSVSGQKLVLIRPKKNFSIENMTIVGNPSATSQNGIRLANASDFAVKNVLVKDCKNNGISFGSIWNFNFENITVFNNVNAGILGAFPTGIGIPTVPTGYFLGINSYNNAYGLDIDTIQDISFVDCSFFDNDTYGIRMQPTANRTRFLNCHAYGNVSDGMNIDNCDRVQVLGGAYRDNGGYGINIGAGSSDCKIVCVDLDGNTSGTYADSGTDTIILGT